MARARRRSGTSRSAATPHSDHRTKNAPSPSQMRKLPYIGGEGGPILSLIIKEIAWPLIPAP